MPTQPASSHSGDVARVEMAVGVLMFWGRDNPDAARRRLTQIAAETGAGLLMTADFVLAAAQTPCVDSAAMYPDPKLSRGPDEKPK